MSAILRWSPSAALVVLLAGFATAQEYPKPGPEQELLKQMEGMWDATMKCQFEQEGADAAPTETKGQMTAKLDVGGFFLVSQFEGEFAGQKFQGRSLTGYDPYQKKYTGVWVDSMSPALYNTQGEFDKAGKIYSEKMEGPGPDGKPMKFRSITKIKDQDHMHFTMFLPGEDGKEAQLMEIEYTRKK